MAANHVIVPLLSITTFVLYFSRPPVKPPAALKLVGKEKQMMLKPPRKLKCDQWHIFSLFLNLA